MLINNNVLVSDSGGGSRNWSNYTPYDDGSRALALKNSRTNHSA